MMCPSVQSGQKTCLQAGRYVLISLESVKNKVPLSHVSCRCLAIRVTPYLSLNRLFIQATSMIVCRLSKISTSTNKIYFHPK
uniref:Uncharacterized protein n=1 Tax=Anguilla anguilla TaxID=7936 RepID=A0A0E9RXS9_ANGAN